jgi:hypothetical protein
MTRINCGYTSGKTIKGKVYTEAGVYKESDVTLTETPAGKGLYIGNTATALAAGDNVLVYDILTSNIEPELHGEYDGNIDSNLTTIVSDIAVLGSDFVVDTAQIVSDIALVYSDTTVLNSNLNALTITLMSDIAYMISDLEEILDDVATQTQEFHI